MNHFKMYVRFCVGSDRLANVEASVRSCGFRRILDEQGCALPEGPWEGKFGWMVDGVVSWGRLTLVGSIDHDGEHGLLTLTAQTPRGRQKLLPVLFELVASLRRELSLLSVFVVGVLGPTSDGLRVLVVHPSLRQAEVRARFPADWWAIEDDMAYLKGPWVACHLGSRQQSDEILLVWNALLFSADYDEEEFLQSITPINWEELDKLDEVREGDRPASGG